MTVPRCYMCGAMVTERPPVMGPTRCMVCEWRYRAVCQCDPWMDLQHRWKVMLQLGECGFLPKDTGASFDVAPCL